jgi:hypothetical protein
MDRERSAHADQQYVSSCSRVTADFDRTTRFTEVNPNTLVVHWPKYSRDVTHPALAKLSCAYRHIGSEYS